MTWWAHDAAVIAFPSALRWTVARVREQHAPDRGAVPRIVLDEPPPRLDPSVVAAPLRVEHSPRGQEEGLTATEGDGRVDVGARPRDDSREDRESRERCEERPPPHRDRSPEARGGVRATLRLRRGELMIHKLLMRHTGSKRALLATTDQSELSF